MSDRMSASERQAIIDRVLGDELVQLLDARRETEAAILTAFLARLAELTGTPLDLSSEEMAGVALLDLLKQRQRIEGTLYATFVNRLYSSRSASALPETADGPTTPQG